MNKTIVIVMVVVGALLAVGCTAPPQHYRPAGHADQWVITGENNALTGRVTIYINGQKVIDDKTSLTGDGNFKGTYKGRPVSATCDQTFKVFLGWRTHCIVFVSNEQAADITF